MARLALCLAALVVAAAAFPSNSFIRLDSYSTNALCSAASSTPQSSSYYALGLCSVSSTSTGGSSTMYAMAPDNANVVQYWTFTGTTCAAGASNPNNYTLASCGATGTLRANALSSSVGLYEVTDYSDSSCATVSSGPSFLMQGCNGGVQITVGGKLTVCYGTATDCSGSQTCASISHGDCVSGDSGSSGSVLYDWNAASSATPAIALTAALIAVVAAVTKF